MNTFFVLVGVLTPALIVNGNNQNENNIDNNNIVGTNFAAEGVNAFALSLKSDFMSNLNEEKLLRASVKDHTRKLSHDDSGSAPVGYIVESLYGDEYCDTQYIGPNYGRLYLEQGVKQGSCISGDTDSYYYTCNPANSDDEYIFPIMEYFAATTDCTGASVTSAPVANYSTACTPTSTFPTVNDIGGNNNFSPHALRTCTYNNNPWKSAQVYSAVLQT